MYIDGSGEARPIYPAICFCVRAFFTLHPSHSRPSSLVRQRDPFAQRSSLSICIDLRGLVQLRDG